MIIISYACDVFYVWELNPSKLGFHFMFFLFFYFPGEFRRNFPEPGENAEFGFLWPVLGSGPVWVLFGFGSGFVFLLGFVWFWVESCFLLGFI